MLSHLTTNPMSSCEDMIHIMTRKYIDISLFKRVAEAMVSERDTISEIHVPKYIDLDGDRREYIHKLVRYRKASSNRKEVIRELIRHRQFLNDENNGDRLRLDVLSSRMQMSKQAMNSVFQILFS